jgi:hypothetical protein
MRLVFGSGGSSLVRSKMQLVQAGVVWAAVACGMHGETL